FQCELCQGRAVGLSKGRSHGDKTAGTFSRHRRERSLEVLDGLRGHQDKLYTELFASVLDRLHAGMWDGVVGFQRTPIRTACGTVSCNISRSLVMRSVRRIDNPVMFPPGRARLATCPTPTGSAWFENTIGIVLVACRAGSTKVEELAKMTSTFMRTNSAASSGSWSTLSAQRNSIRMSLPST